MHIILHTYLLGLLLGFSYVVPIGVQNLFVMNTALTQPRKRVLITALIVIFFDISLGLACFFGIGLLLEASPFLEKLVLAVGSIVVFRIGYDLIRHFRVSGAEAEATSLSIRGVMTRAFVVTWCNPQAIIDGSMMLGAAGASVAGDIRGFFIFGFASASIIWFLSLSGVLSHFRKSLKPRYLSALNLICGIVLIGYAIWLFAHFVQLVF